MAKADPTLVNAGLREATSRAGADVPNMKPMFDSTSDLSAAYSKQIFGIMKSFQDKKDTKRIAKEKQLGKFTKIVDDSWHKIYNLKEPLSDKTVRAVERHVEKKQAEFEEVNSLGKNDTKENARARTRIMGELQRTINQIVETRAGFMKMKTNSENMNMGLVDDDIIDPATDMIDFGNHDTNDNLSIDINSKGEVVFTTKNYWGDANSTWGDPVSMTMKQLLEAFPGINPKDDADYMEQLTSSSASGATAAGENNPTNNYDVNAQRGLFLDRIKDDDDFNNFTGRRVGNINMKSFEEALLGGLDIPVSALDNMFIDDNGERMDIGSVFAELDVNKDGFINEKDEVLTKALGPEAIELFEANIENMIDAIINPSNDAFSLSVSKELLADYYVGAETTDERDAIIGIDQQKYNKSFDKTIEANKKEKERNKKSYTPANYKVKGVNVSNKDWNKNYKPYISWLENPIEGTTHQTPSGDTVKFEGGKFFGWNIEGGKWNGPFDLQRIAQQEGLINYVEGANINTSSENYNTDAYNIDSDFNGTTAIELLTMSEIDAVTTLRTFFKVDEDVIIAGSDPRYGKEGVIVPVINDEGEDSGELISYSLNTRKDIEKLMRYFSDKGWQTYINKQ